MKIGSDTNISPAKVNTYDYKRSPTARIENKMNKLKTNYQIPIRRIYRLTDTDKPCIKEN